jgi:threonine dehydratase
MEPIGPIPLEAIGGARGRIAGVAVRTPLLRLDEGGPYPRPSTSREAPTPGSVEDVAGAGIWLKLECLQPIGSFKIRGAANALALAGAEALAGGVYTASAGNMAQGVALAARRVGVRCRVIVPDTAPRTKVEAVERLGAEVVPLPFDEWWATIEEHGHPDEAGFFVHPVSDPAVIAGNGTIGLEILEDLPATDAVIVPYGGGGLSCGIASALRARRPEAEVYAAEVETAAPLAASLQAGAPVSVDRRPTFVDGIGGSSVLREMWPLAPHLLSGSLVVSIEEICDAIRTLATRAHVVAEGAGGSAVAAALDYRDREDPDRRQRIVAVVSGGNIDAHVLRAILMGENPDA